MGIEYQWESWSALTGLVGQEAAAAQVAVLAAGSVIKRRLGLRAEPFRFRGSADGLQFQASGLAGSLSLREVSLEIVPKFVWNPEHLPAWSASTLFLLEALAGKHVISLLAQRQQWKAHRVIDLLAHAFADAADRGFRDQLIQIYRQNEESSVVLRGRLNVARQLRNYTSAPHLLECDVDQLDVVNPFNDVLKWAATVLASLAVDGDLTTRLTLISHSIPGDVERSAALRYHRLLPPPQFQAWSDALELARLLASGMALSSSGGRTSGYSLLFNMERGFERFVEIALARALPKAGDDALSSSRQETVAYAYSTSAGGRTLYCRPDNVVKRQGSVEMVVDAKYKLLDRDLAGAGSAAGAPASQDVYELVAGMLAHRCHVGLLVYPASTLSSEQVPTLKTWHIDSFGTVLRIGALAVDMLNLRSRADLAKLISTMGEQMMGFLEGAR